MLRDLDVFDLILTIADVNSLFSLIALLSLTSTFAIPMPQDINTRDNRELNLVIMDILFYLTNGQVNHYC